MPQTAQNLLDKFPNFLPTSFDDFFTWSAFQVGIVVLGLNYGAYMTEIFRAGIQSVSHGQAEAADALGMTYRQKMRRVVLPQAFRVVIPPTGNEFIAMMKDTALVSVLGQIDRVDGALPPGAAARERGRATDGGPRHGRGALLGPDGRLHVLPEPAGASGEQGLRPDRRRGPQGP